MMTELTLTEIWIYPIKSLGGIRLTSAKVLPKGLQYDRRWMLVDEHGAFMTQRVHSQMALLKTKISETHLMVSHKDKFIELSLLPAYQENRQVKIWDDTVTAFEVDVEVSKWFSERLDSPCKLVYFPEQNARPVDPLYKVNNEHVSLADAYPFLIIGESSLADLNDRLSQPVPMNRFRPNFVFTGGVAFEEDTWRNFSIGNNRFVGVKKCARCVVPTVDQETAARGVEPLKTLASYRTQKNKVYFGQNLVAVDHHEIKVGDRIKIESYQ
jgi:uncharacterized protein YcbX